MASRSIFGDQRGFTIIEVLVAATLLVIGVLGTMAMVDSSNAETRLSGGRDGATNLVREVVEGARSSGYDQLQPASVQARLQALPGLASLSGATWTVSRRGITYTLSTSLCSVDDPKDGYGTHAGATYCADSSTTGTTDAQAEDFKRLTVDASWVRNSGTRTVRQVALINSAGAKGPPISSLVATAPVVPDPAAPRITSNVSSVAFKATAPSGVASVVYSLDGVDKGNATAAANGNDWTFDIPVDRLSDGGYDVSVRAVDARGKAGPTFTIPMTLIRSQPAAPAGLVAGPNTIYVNGAQKAVIELEWNANSERNVIGYRVYNSGNALVCPANAQTLSLKLSCIDMQATGGTYSVFALYRDAGGTVRQGPASTVSVNSSPPRTYYFKQTTQNTLDGSKCESVLRKRDMEIGYAGTDPEESADGKVDNFLNFCSSASGSVETLPAGTTTMSGYISNTDKNPCNLTVSLKKNGTTLLGQSTLTLPGLAGATPIQRTWTFSNSSTTLVPGDRLNLHMNWLDTGAGCDHTIMHWGGTTYRSSLTVPGNTISPPNPPTGLSATTLADGTTQLSWSAPTAGSAVSFYRIYRDGIDYTNRIDTTGSANETTYVDDPGGTTHTYYVTAASDILAESTMAGPVTK